VTGDPDPGWDERMHHDDPRLDLVWSKCAELNMPVNIHIADHPSAWEPLDVFQERTPDYQHFNLHGDDILSHGELLATRDRLLEKHPDTTFIACHLSNQGHDLASLSQALDRYPNLYLDISARDYEVGRTPRAAGKFLEQYQDRILFGTDMGMQKSMYRAWWRLLETDDEYMTGRVWWPYYGLDLSDAILELLYRDNARKIMNWETV
jgi:predicted TIM-barrel fold metal-dependent hydrolase